MPWLDAELGGFPGNGVFALEARSGGGKTSFALANAIAALRRGPVCMVTNEAPEAILETAQSVFEIDLRPAIANSAFAILSFAPFFVNKVRSLNSVEAPMAELGEFLRERQAHHVVLDTLDPVLSWVEPANAKLAVRTIMAQLRDWNMGVMCTLGAGMPVGTEFARTASASLELADRDATESGSSQPGSRLIVRHAAWCNVYGAEASVQLVQGRGFVAVPGAALPKRSRAPEPMSSPARPEAAASRPFSQPESGAFTLIGDPRGRDVPPGTLAVSQPMHGHPPAAPGRVPAPNTVLARQAPPPARVSKPAPPLSDDTFRTADDEASPRTMRIPSTYPIEDSAPTIVRKSELEGAESERTIARPPGKFSR